MLLVEKQEHGVVLARDADLTCSRAMMRTLISAATAATSKRPCRGRTRYETDADTGGAVDERLCVTTGLQPSEVLGRAVASDDARGEPAHRRRNGCGRNDDGLPRVVEQTVTSCGGERALQPIIVRQIQVEGG
jgi:hypothetical protein